MKFANKSEAYVWMHANRNKRVFFESLDNTYFVEMNELGMLKENCLKFLEDDAHNFRTEDDKPEIDWEKVKGSRKPELTCSEDACEMIKEYHNQLMPILEERFGK